MATRRKDKAIHQPWEGRNPAGSFAKITLDMMQSDAWKALNLRQQALYVNMKAKYRQKKEHGVITESNWDNITIPHSEYMQYYGSNKTFLADIRVLIDVGLIDLKESGRSSRTPNVYAYSDRWKQYRLPKQAKQKRGRYGYI